MTESYDLIAIGAGPAGESATELASFFGLRSAVIEMNRPGGTVTTTGGAPTKTLREAALFVSGFRDADVYGLRMTAPPDVAMDVVRTRTWGVCSQLQDLTKANILARNVDYIEGRATLDGKGAVVVSREGRAIATLHAKAVLIATGSRPGRPQGAALRTPRRLRYRYDSLSGTRRAQSNRHRRRRSRRNRVRNHLPRAGS